MASLRNYGSIYGTVTLPSGHRLACGLLTIHEDGSVVTASIGGGKVSMKRSRPGQRRDWLNLYIDLGALGRLDPRVGLFPMMLPDDPEETWAWRRPIDDWMADIGSRTYRVTPFRMGVIGPEFLFDIKADQLRNGIPSRHGYAFLWPVDGEVVYYPATY
jgi:hypothetical protein